MTKVSGQNTAWQEDAESRYWSMRFCNLLHGMLPIRAADGTPTAASVVDLQLLTPAQADRAVRAEFDRDPPRL